MKSVVAVVGTSVLGVICVLAWLIVGRLFLEFRYLPSSSMEPNFQINDRVLLEKVSTFLRTPYNRGDVIVFYPPTIEMGGKPPSQDPLDVLGRLTGLPCLPYDVAFIKRIIGVPGDTIRMQAGVGVYINGILLDESDYIKEPAAYNLNVLGEIGGRAVDGSIIRPYGQGNQADEPVKVPQGKLFVLGDNRNNAEDSLFSVL